MVKSAPLGTSRLLLAALLLAATVAFQASPPRPRRARARSAVKPLRTAAELTPVDEMCIENVAEFCLHETCDVEEYEALINQLEEQKSHFIRHVANVENLLTRLKDSNRPEHDPDDVKALIDGIKETLANPPDAKGKSADLGV
ncbi:hypothetical protein ACHAWF_004095 [Thalassiosira exigua]